MNKNTYAIVLAFLAAMFYAINTPLSKLLLVNVPPTYMAGFLYLGAGIGVGILYVFHWKKESLTERLTKGDFLDWSLVGAAGNVLLGTRKQLYEENIGETLTWSYLAALVIMLLGTALVIADTLK